MPKGTVKVLALLFVLLLVPLLAWGCRAAVEDGAADLPEDETGDVDGTGDTGEEEPGNDQPPADQPGESDTESSDQAGQMVKLTLYFPDKHAVESDEPGETGYVKPVVRVLPYTPQVLRLAMEELIRGPLPAEGGVNPIIPTATKIRGIKIENGTAVINFSSALLHSPDSPGGSFGGSLFVQAVVFTATEFPTVQNVLVQVEGEPYCDGHFIWEQPISRESLCGG